VVVRGIVIWVWHLGHVIVIVMLNGFLIGGSLSSLSWDSFVRGSSYFGQFIVVVITSLIVVFPCQIFCQKICLLEGVYFSPFWVDEDFVCGVFSEDLSSDVVIPSVRLDFFLCDSLPFMCWFLAQLDFAAFW